MNQLRILLADDHQMLRQGIAQIIDLQVDMTVVAQASNGREAVAMAVQHKPDIALLDINMPELDGVEVARRLSQSMPNMGLIILTMYRRDRYVFEAIKAGAKGYLLKEATLDELMDGIRAVGRGDAVIDGAMAKLLLQELRGESGTDTSEAQLSDRDVMLLQHLGEGLSNRQIGKRLEVAEKTIRNRVSLLCRQLQLKNRTQAALYAIRKGLVEPDESDNQ